MNNPKTYSIINSNREFLMRIKKSLFYFSIREYVVHLVHLVQPLKPSIYAGLIASGRVVHRVVHRVVQGCSATKT